MSNIKPDIQAWHSEVTAWRHDFHRHPEILYEVHRTAGIIAEKLRQFGCDEVVEGIGKTGVVGVVTGRGASDAVIGLRTDMDALPITELNEFAHKSQTEGSMHACGHDGHTAMLLAAAKYLAQTRNFAGRVVLIFQPAEEGGAGGKAMVDDGLMEQFNIQRVFGMHNLPGLPAGEFATRPGTIMAASDFFDIVIDGTGGHAALPNLCVDPIVIGAKIIDAVQTLVSREINPLTPAVISICSFHAGNAYNVIPSTAKIGGTLRTISEDMRTFLSRRIGELSEKIGAAHGAQVHFDYLRLYPPTINDSKQMQIAANSARYIVGNDKVNDEHPPLMGGEDFSFMLNARPGAFIFIGNGNSAGLHHPRYDFNDDIIPLGASYWAILAETQMPLQSF